MKTNTNYTPVIGLEVHVELNTKSKMFCGCANDWFGTTPNSRTCPVCLGLPGALPVPNQKAIESCIKIGLALHCSIPLVSKFDRKNYFYPDLAKGYQISQYDQPFAEKGWIELSSGKRIGITRAHMEEDTGKLLHETIEGQHVSLIDFNRSGVPLVEIVTDPDFTSAQEVKEYLQKLQQIVRYLDVSHADMDKGEMRLEPNISLRVTSANSPRPASQGEGKGEGRTFELPNYKVEVKNINSFSFVEKAIEFEIKRQAEILDRNETPAQETRGWDEDKKITISQRSKEDAADYRYFPEPDIPPFVWTEKFITELAATIPELPDEKRARFIQDYTLSAYNAELLTKTKELAEYFEEAVSLCHPASRFNRGNGSEGSLKVSSSMPQNDITPTTIANTIINKKVNIDTILPAQLIKNMKAAIVEDTMSEKELQKIVEEVLAENEKSVTDYKNGKTNAIMFLLGQTMRKVAGKAAPTTVRSTLEKMLQ